MTSIYGFEVGARLLQLTDVTIENPDLVSSHPKLRFVRDLMREKS
jgi:hypothetical protein